MQHISSTFLHQFLMTDPCLLFCLFPLHAVSYSSHMWGCSETASVIGYAGTNGCLFNFPPCVCVCVCCMFLCLDTMSLHITLMASPTLCIVI